MSFLVKAEHERERLQYFASHEGRDDLYQYNRKERRTVLEDFPSVQMPFEWLVQLAPPLKSRAFSISSSLLAHPNEIKCSNRARGFGTCWLQRNLYMLQAPQPKRPRIFIWSTFEEIVSKEGGIPKDSATIWLKALNRAGKYHVEAWS
ncbi:hypothetical protein QYF36_020769 [Acer negundo]|nr:hypothetical protein QYF36_020769 [Acer negundo]